MSGVLLLFVSDGLALPHGWLRVADGRIVARGGAETLPPAADEGEEAERTVLVVPGADVVLHWIELPALAPAQALAAARLLASEVVAEPVERLHLALGAEEGETRAMALVSTARMAAWIAQAQALGRDPEAVIPEPLLLLPPEEGLVSVDQDGQRLVRGAATALAAEPELAAITAGESVALDMAAFEAGIPLAVAEPAVDLRQGPFARRRRWKIDWALTKRLAALIAGILLVTLLIQVALIARYSAAASDVEEEIAAVATKALPRSGRIANPAAQLAARLTALRGGGIGYSAAAAGVFAAVRDTPNVELSNLVFESDGSLKVTALAPTPGDIAGFQQRLSDQGFGVQAGTMHTSSGRQSTELTVRPR